MKSKEGSRTYSYLFNSPVRNNERTTLSGYENSDILSKNAKINFRYFGQTHENTSTNHVSDPDLAKFSSFKDKTTQAIKKYTFSGLTKHPKECFKSDVGSLPNQIASATKPANSYNPQFQPNGLRKFSVQNEEDVISPSQKKELKTQSSAQNKSMDDSNNQTILQQKIEDLTHQTEILKVRAEQFKKVSCQHQKKISDLMLELKSAYETIGRQDEMIQTLKRKEIDNINLIQQLLNKLEVKEQPELSLDIVPSVISQTFQLRFEDKRVPKTERVEIKSFMEEYKEVLQLFGFQINHQSCHQQLLNHIQQTQKSFEELTKRAIKFSELQKEKGKLMHTLKKNQTQLSRLCHDNTFLSHQLSKNIQLLSEYNQQISILHLKQIQSKMAAKYCSID